MKEKARVAIVVLFMWAIVCSMLYGFARYLAMRVQ
jgi:hypothetical protein